VSDETLTRKERLTFYNQFKILQQLATDPEDAKHYEELCNVLQNGWQLEYHKVFASIWGEEVSRQDGRFVMDVLDMFKALQLSHSQLVDKNGIDTKDLIFSGFDGNNETDLMSYTEYLKDEAKRWKDELANAPMDSHRPRRDFYQRMMDRWNEAKDKWKLTNEEIKHICWWKQN
jgi:uncharacterized protein